MLFSEARQLADNAPESPRVVVIGAGAVGLYVASLLAARGRQVVLLEAGGSDLATFAAESYCSVGRRHEGIQLARGRCMGGTTNLWGGQLVEFQPLDFDGRPWLPGSKWPVSYEEIAPYFAPTYEYLGVPPQSQHDDEIWRGISCPRPEVGADFEVFLTRWMWTPNMAVLFGNQIKNDPKLAVLSGHTAVGFRGENGRLQGVRVLDKAGQSHWIEGDTFVLAAGTIENSRLLLHAADDPAWSCPWRGNQNLGRYFQDHLGGRLGPIRPASKKTFFNMFGTILFAGRKFQPKIRMRNDVQAARRMLNIQAMFAFEGRVSEHLVYLRQFLKAAVFSRRLTGVGDLFRHGIGAVRYLVPLMWRYLVDHRVFIPSTANIFVGVQAEQVACAESAIRIDKSVLDAYGLPRVILDWRTGGHEMESLRAFAVQLRDQLAASGIGHLELDEDLFAPDDRFLAKMSDTYHQAGGTIMGESAEDGVVDRNLCVFGTENLYVGGASVFRTASNANVTFTALAFATRLVEHLAGPAPVTSPLLEAAAR